jgi:RimJ/RimL family protein N-acetyltransferase
MTWLQSEISRRIIVDDLVIRSLEVPDAGQAVEAVSESLLELSQWMPWAQFEPQSVTQREELIVQWSQDWEEKKDFPVGIFRDDQLVGCSGLHLRHGVGQIEIGYWVRTSCVGQGIATGSSRALVGVAFALPEVHEVLIAHDIANVRSQFIPERLGFTRVKEYDSAVEANASTGRTRLWSMKREAWRAD